MRISPWLRNQIPSQFIDIAVIFLLSLTLLTGCFPLGRIVTVTVPVIGTSISYNPVTKQPVEITDEFLTTTPQITVFFEAYTSVPMDVTYRWYYEETLILEFTVPLDQGYNFGWINPQEELAPGQYKVEISSGTLLYRDVSFRVIRSQM